MKVDDIVLGSLATAADRAPIVERAGYDGIWTAESGHDPLLPLAVAADRTDRITLGTSIAVAFGRSPMTLAYSARDLHDYSGGRFILGLGSQIKAHVERRYSMPWSHPAARMHEYMAALRAIWSCWQNGTELDFRGTFYTHTLMPPTFNPGPSAHGAPKIFLAAVGPAMTKVAAEAADGILLHGFTTERYIREATLPVLSAGLGERNLTLADFEISYPVFVVTGTTDQEKETAAIAVRKRLAFYGSTPAYRPVLELHGWGELQTDLRALSKQDRWDEMGRLVTDGMLDAFAVRAEPDQVATEIVNRFGDVVDRVSLYMPQAADGSAAHVAGELQELTKENRR